MEKFQEVLQSKPHVLLGKGGVTPAVIDHIQMQLKQHIILKLKIHPDTVKEKGRDVIIEEVMQGLHAYVLDVRGFTFVISKKKLHDVHMPKKFLEIYLNLPPKPRKAKRQNAPVTQSKEAITPIQFPESDPDFSSKPEPEFIDYDDENLVARIDQQSNEIYGAVQSPRTGPKPKRKRSSKPESKKRSPKPDGKKRSSKPDTNKPKKFVRKSLKKLTAKREKKAKLSGTEIPVREKKVFTGKRRKGPSRPARKKKTRF